MQAARRHGDREESPRRVGRPAGIDDPISAGSLVPLGDAGVLSFPKSGRVILLNAAARRALERRRREARKHGVAGARAGRMREDGSADADLEALTAELARLAKPPAARKRPPGFGAGEAVSLEGVFAPGPLPVRVRIHGCPRLARLVEPVLRGCRSTTSTRRSLIVLRRARTYEIHSSGRLLSRVDHRFLARSEILRHLLLKSHGRRQWLAILHASAVAGEAGGWLLCGPSGSGKSTLASALLAEGLRLVTDDYAPIDVASGRLHPVPYALGIKDRSLELLSAVMPGLSAAPRLRFRNRVVRYLPPPAPVARPVPVQGILFPCFDPACRGELVPLSPEDAFVLSAQGGGWYEASPARIRGLIRWFRERPAWALSYPDTLTALDLLAPILER